MSIYRRSDRVPLSDVALSAAPRPAGVRSDTGEDWTKRRAAQPANGLLKPTIAWAAMLPPKAKPAALLTNFPRIANLLAVLWQDPNSLRAYLEDLLVDKRGNRQGFPLDVLRELLELRAFYDNLHPPILRPWEVMNKDE
jgi:hypothetical protein